MKILGIESSCDECSIAVVEDGKTILSHVVATQIEFHKPFAGVVPEIASRKHVEWILPVFHQALEQGGLSPGDIQGIGVTNRPGLSGSLIVGLTFAKALSLSWKVPFVGVDHVLAHLYAPQLSAEIDYPFIGLLVSGGHSIIARVSGPLTVEVLGASIDDAIGEAFDKVAKHLGLGYPGGKVIDDLARKGNAKAFQFPFANLYKSGHAYDVSYSGLKNAVINQQDLFWDGESPRSIENICASFERVAVDTLLKKLQAACRDTGINRVVAGGGVAANSYLRDRLQGMQDIRAYYPPLDLCTDNGAMIAGLAFHYLTAGLRSGLDETVYAKVPGFRRITS
ncbi:tRNA (adenosine(37)-N6)-threonylcarbamoyltransferase complex transferase subunit TsaD [Spirochaeta lutea]|uniref:tRNA N6-adenosine threonylcarbamoyltransferase n=1 Tax=Spirochaeta lutea TaxID=1480694 RepID=A0A098R183_9SPIO|nr:tRNA (adenosine(37)-N6)-threonylcarbamoyltransferase complex transferase subunit TsaD [Spirochaeta lutea]KGE73870.1 protein kinase [Spirochaeta lutea]